MMKVLKKPGPILQSRFAMKKLDDSAALSKESKEDKALNLATLIGEKILKKSV